MRSVLLSVLIAPLFAAATLDGVNLGTPISGPPVTADDLKGRVVLFEYWGVNCPPCKASIVHLTGWQNEYDRDTFLIVANHCQGGPADNTRSVWKANGGSDAISVVDSGDLSGSNVSGIPRCFLFDHEGKLIFDGSPFDVEESLKKAVANSPGSLVAGYEWKALKREAMAIGKRQGMGSALKSVRKLATGDGAGKTEADEMLSRVNAWNDKQMLACSTARQGDPAEAYRIAATMAMCLKGDELAEPYDQAVKELKADKEAMNAIKAAELLAKIKAAADAYGLTSGPDEWLARASNKAKAQEIAGGLKTLVTKFAGTKSADEAARLAKEWKLGG